MNCTIIICTFNRHKELRSCLQSISEANIPNSIDVLVVDNCPSKSCKSVVDNVPAFNRHPSYLSLSTASLSLARNAGYQTARTDYVAYIDDDALINEKWVAQLVEMLTSGYEIFGGPYTYHSDHEVPGWYPTEALEFGSNLSTGILPKDVYLSGTNMVFRTDLLKRLGGFDENFGMSGSKQYYGEETDFQIRARKRGIEIQFDSNLKVSHLAANYKLNLKWLLLALYLNGVGHPSSKTIGGVTNIIAKFCISFSLIPLNLTFYYIFKNQPFPYSIYKSLKHPLFFWGCLTSLFTYRS